MCMFSGVRRCQEQCLPGSFPEAPVPRGVGTVSFCFLSQQLLQRVTAGHGNGETGTRRPSEPGGVR